MSWLKGPSIRTSTNTNSDVLDGALWVLIFNLLRDDLYFKLDAAFTSDLALDLGENSVFTIFKEGDWWDVYTFNDYELAGNGRDHELA